MTKLEKIKALVEYEVIFMIENGNATDAKHAAGYIVALFDTFTNEAIDKLYDAKIGGYEHV